MPPADHVGLYNMFCPGPELGCSNHRLAIACAITRTRTPVRTPLPRAHVSRGQRECEYTRPHRDRQRDAWAETTDLASHQPMVSGRAWVSPRCLLPTTWASITCSARPVRTPLSRAHVSLWCRTGSGSRPDATCQSCGHPHHVLEGALDNPWIPAYHATPEPTALIRACSRTCTRTHTQPI